MSALVSLFLLLELAGLLLSRERTSGDFRTVLALLVQLSALPAGGPLFGALE